MLISKFINDVYEYPEKWRYEYNVPWRSMTLVSKRDERIYFVEWTSLYMYTRIYKPRYLLYIENAKQNITRDTDLNQIESIFKREQDKKDREYKRQQELKVQQVIKDYFGDTSNG